VFIGSFLHEPFMGNVVIEDEFEREMRRLGVDEPIVRALALLDRRIQRLASMPDDRARQQQEKSAYLEKGIAHLALGELERAIAAFMCALRADGLNDPEVLAYLGRALAEHGADLDAAVAHLQSALEQWRDGEAPAYIYYYYCKALQDRMENRQREDSERLERTWRKYLELGAPFGHRMRRNVPSTR
jgi:tetratricopeptide (TPR) repeat protein